MFLAVHGLSLVAASRGLLSSKGFALDFSSQWLLLLWGICSRCRRARYLSCTCLVVHCSMWDLPRLGMEPLSPELAGGFLTEEEKLKFYITSCWFCLCNSACSLQSLDHVGLIVSESGDLTILGTGAYLTRPCPALYNCLAPANLLNHACLCKRQASPSPS